MSLELPEGQKLHSLLVQGAPVSDCPHGEKHKMLLFQFTPFILSSLPLLAAAKSLAHLADDLLGAGVSSLQPSPL